MNEKFSCPWPGPRPYEVQDGYVFFGREDEIIAINRMILNNPVTILSADSGVGKTSLLQAGLVYGLLEKRSKGKDVKPILLLHKWSGAIVLPIETIFSDALKAAIEYYDLLAKKAGSPNVPEFLHQQAKRDYELLSSVDPGNSFIEHIKNICNHPEIGGVILIMDQFEEILRSREENVIWAFKTISKIYNHESRIKMVISLRREFESHLGGLQSETALPLGNLTKLLKPMVVKSARRVILDVADRVKNIKVVPPVDQYLIEKISSLTSSSQIDNEKGESKKTTEEDTVDLLRLQAILRQLYERCYDPQRPDKVVAIDLKALKDYEGQFGPGEMVGQSLLRWIETALGTPSPDWLKQISEVRDDRSNLPLHLRELYMLPEIDSTGFIRRVGANLSSYLSSGGLKLSQEQSGLLFNTLDEDFRRIYKDFNPHDWIIYTEPYLKMESSNIIRSHADDTNDSNLSGVARIKGWTPLQTIEILVAIFYETLLRLKEQYILKEIQTDNRIFYELTHDGLGEPFKTWAGKQFDTWQDCLYSLTINRGIDLVINEQVGDNNRIIEKNRWRGCYINPQGDGRVLKNIKFLHSELVGSVFENCYFQGVVFEDCNLDGSIFINCRLEPAPGSREPVLFKNCRANGMTFISVVDENAGDLCVLNNVLFEDCKLSQINFHGILLEGNVHFGAHTEIIQAQFRDIKVPVNDRSTRITMGEDTEQLQYCIWDMQSLSVLDFGNFMMSQKVSSSGFPAKRLD